MSAATKKPPATGSGRNTPSSPAGRASPRAGATTTNGVNRTRSTRGGSNGTPVSARAAVKRPGAGSNLSNSTTQQQDAAEEDNRAEMAALIQELKDRLQKAETASEEYQKQIEVLHSRLDEAHKEQAKLEERVHEEEERVEVLQNEKREAVRLHRELENIYEAERAATMKDKEEAQAREDELHETIQRLKDNLAQRDARQNGEEEESLSPGFRNSSRSNSNPSFDNGQFAPPATIQRSNSRNNSKLLLQKDKVIESLRLELAEAQIKSIEMENAGGGRLQELEKELLQTRMTNARLMEDNESYQLLLGEKTLNGDFARGDFLRAATPSPEEREHTRARSTSLADELQSFEESDAAEVRKLESEINHLKEQNKALTLYINKIIERLLQHQGFETILDKDNEDSTKKPNTDKDLPPPPPKDGQGPSFVQRTKSITGTRNRPRPMSMAPPPRPSPNLEGITTDPATAPSIPLGRAGSQRIGSGSYTHRRSTSEWSSAATVVSNMYRAPVPVSNPTSPGMASPRTSIFGLPVNTGTASSRVPSGASSAPRASIDEGRQGGPVEAISAADGAPPNIDTPSPPRSTTSSQDRNSGSGNVMAGNKMRPLRLVQETAEADEQAQKQQKQANRASWLGWFNKGSSAPSPPMSGTFDRRLSGVSETQ